MADSKISALTAVVTPAGTDEFAVNQGGTSKKMTLTQILDGTVPATIPDPLLLGAGSAAAPTFSFSGDPDTGIYNFGADILAFTTAGAVRGTWNATELAVVGDFRTSNGSSSVLKNEVASATNPTVVPDQADLDTGLGSNAADQLSLIAGGLEGLRINENVGVVQNAAVTGTTAAPAYSFISDLNSGMYSVGADDLGIVAGGVLGLRLTELNSNVIPSYDADLTVTAFATGGQASATQLDAGYNVLSIVATAGDSVKLPPTFPINSVVFIKNDGAAAADVFPATGDNLGQGLNVAESLSAGQSITYIATVASSTWTPLIPESGGTIFPLLASDGTAAAPSYSFSGDPNTGIFSTGIDDIGFSTGGTETFQMLDLNSGTFRGALANAPGIRNVAATGTAPGIYVNADDTNTGLGYPGNDAMSLVSGGQNWLQGTEAGAVVTILMGTATGTTTHTGTFGMNQAAGPALLDEDASATNPTIVPNQADPDTGIGRSGIDQLAMVCGGVQVARFTDSVDLAAGQTALRIFDKDNALLEIVTVGAADSGGTGFKVLRIPN